MAMMPAPEQIASQAIGIVSAQLSAASTAADAAVSAATTAINALSAADFNVEWDAIPLSEVSAGGLTGLNPVEPVLEGINDVTIAATDLPYSPPDAVDSTLVVGTAPESSITVPDFGIPDFVDLEWPVLSATMPSVGTPVLPTSPTVDLPAVPSIGAISIPSPPEYSIPEYDWTMPVDDLTPPTTQFSWVEANYTSEVKDRLASVLYHELGTGGSGLGEEVEQAIYDRAVSRQEDEHQESYNKTLNFFASRGFSIPPGALAGALLEIENKIIRARADLNNDILIQESKLAQNNTHFIIDSAIKSEKDLMDLVSQLQSRSLDAAKYTITAAVEMYNLRVQTYVAKLEAYKTLAQIYQARIQGEIAKAEFYKAQMQGITAGVQAQGILIEAYKAQVLAATSLIELYKAEMEGAKIEAEIDKTRIAGYATQVQAYGTQVDAVGKQYDGYKIQVEGETAKAEFYKAQVEAYKGEVEAYAITSNTAIEVLKTELMANQQEVEIFKSRITEYQARVAATVEQAKIDIQNEGFKIDSYKAGATVYATAIDGLSKSFTAQVQQVIANSELQVKEADVAVAEVGAREQAIQANIRAAGAMAGQVAASSLSAISASAHIGHSDSKSDSSGLSHSNIWHESEAHSISNATQHIFTSESVS